MRKSNIELYRIIVMLLIVAHHYVVNSGLMEAIENTTITTTSCAMLLFGAWGKIGINCFVFITGWFMCQSHFSWQKFIKLYAQITVYAVGIYIVFSLFGYEKFKPVTMLLKFFPVRDITDVFTSCFLVFYLTIPFLNVLLQNLTQKQHLYLTILLLTIYSLLPSIFNMPISFNYVEWFIVLYILAAYMRKYGDKYVQNCPSIWGWLTLTSAIIASIAVVVPPFLYKYGILHHYLGYSTVSDSNKILALFVAVTSFMWFKDLRIPNSKFINTIAGATFGVLLIHANSDAMRNWLWRKTIDCVGHFSDNFIPTVGYAAVMVLAVFSVCAAIDLLRGRLMDNYVSTLYFRIKARNHQPIESQEQ